MAASTLTDRQTDRQTDIHTIFAMQSRKYRAHSGSPQIVCQSFLLASWRGKILHLDVLTKAPTDLQLENDTSLEPENSFTWIGLISRFRINVWLKIFAVEALQHLNIQCNTTSSSLQLATEKRICNAKCDSGWSSCMPSSNNVAKWWHSNPLVKQLYKGNLAVYEFGKS